MSSSALGMPLSPRSPPTSTWRSSTDTGSFHYSGISPRTFEICRAPRGGRRRSGGRRAQRLRQQQHGPPEAVRRGAERDADRSTGRIAIVYVDHEMARAAGGTYEDTEGLINLPLTVQGDRGGGVLQAGRRATSIASACDRKATSTSARSPRNTAAAATRTPPGCTVPGRSKRCSGRWPRRLKRRSITRAPTAEHASGRNVG